MAAEAATLRSSRFAVWLGAAMACLAACGCTAKDPFPGARLQGAVRVDSQPVAEGSITFLPLEKDGGKTTGATITNGRYDCRDVPLGRVSVVLNATRATGKMETRFGPPTPVRITIIPEKYRSGIEINVAGDNPKQDFLLSSGSH